MKSNLSLNGDWFSISVAMVMKTLVLLTPMILLLRKPVSAFTIRRLPFLPHRNRIPILRNKDFIKKEWKEEIFTEENLSLFEFGVMTSNNEKTLVQDLTTYEGNIKIQNILNESKVSRDEASKNRAAQEVDEILWKLEQLHMADTVTYNLVLNAFAKSSLTDSAQQALKILQRMEDAYQMQLHLTTENQSANTDITVKPNVRTFSTVIDALTKSPGMEPTDAAQASQELLERLGYLYEATGDTDLQPNTILYNSVINSWAKTETLTGALNAMKLLEYMEEANTPSCEPDVITYNTCIHAWAKCRMKESGERAESLLRRMEGLHSMTCKPNIRTYSSCIDAWCSSNSPSAARRAHALLDELEAIYEETGDVNMQPNAFTYSSVINALARSKQSEKKAASALQVLKRMKEMYESGKNPLAKPTIVSYNSVLNACATTYGRSNYGTKEEERTDPSLTSQSQYLALGIVRVIYRELTCDNSEITPDHFTYGTVLKACANLMTPLDEEGLLFIRQVFEKCCNDGQVSFGVLFQLRQAASIELYRDLIPSEAIDTSNDHFILEKIPSSWSRNVKEKTVMFEK